MNSADSAALRVQFVHGLESGPGSSKSVYLAGRFNAITPAMDTSDFEASVCVQAEHVRSFAPHVLVGSSFGGAVVLALLQRGVFKGPSLLLAPAHRHYGIEESVPAGIPVILAHGTEDSVVAIDGSRSLSKTGSPGRVELVEVRDEHRLASLLVGEALADLVRRVARMR